MAAPEVPLSLVWAMEGSQGRFGRHLQNTVSVSVSLVEETEDQTNCAL